MSAPDSVTMDSFLLAVQRRLWSKRLAEAGHKLLWYAGIALLVLAGVHRLIAALTITLAAAVVGLLACVLAFQVVRQRPSDTQCAAHADRAFGGCSLMTTAVEYRNKSEDAGSFAVRTVLRQANDAAQSWSPEISQRIRQAPTSTTVLAIIPLFIALVLLSLPGAELSIKADQSGVYPVPSSTADNDKNPDRGTNDVAELRRIIADETFANARPSVEQPSATEIVPAQNNETRTVPEVATLAEQAGNPGGVGSLAGSEDSLPGNAMARSTPPVNAPTAAASFRERQRVELQRTGPTMSAGPGDNAYSGDNRRRAMRQPELVRAAAAPESLTHSTILSRAQAAYARLYLEESGRNND